LSTTIQTPDSSGRLPRDAVADLYTLYRARIHAYCVGQLRDRQEADDAVQSTFLYAFALLRRGIEPRAALPWLYTIAHNVCRTRRRALKRRGRVESAVELDAINERIGRDDPTRDDLDAIAAALATLPEAQRNAFLLREWQGLSYSEIASRLGLTESAVEAALFRARRNLAQRLQQAAERVAVALNGLLLVRSVRRAATYASTAKATAGAAVLGVAAGAALTPLGDVPQRHRSAAPRPRSHVAAVHAAPTEQARQSQAATAWSVTRTSAPDAREQAQHAHTGPVAPASPEPVGSEAAPSVATPPPAPDAPPPTARPGTPAAPTPAPAVGGPSAPLTQTVADAVDAVQTLVPPVGDAVDDVVQVAAGAEGTVDDVVHDTVQPAVGTVTNALPTLPLPPKKGTLPGGGP
jgi:RNA polymerase sigma factor (sigma-70 family)